MHGGISPQLNNLEQLRNIKRPSEPGDDGLDVDLIWLVLYLYCNLII